MADRALRQERNQIILRLEPTITTRSDPTTHMATQTKKPRRRQRLGLTRRHTTRKRKQADEAEPTDGEFAASDSFKSARGMRKPSHIAVPCFNQQTLIVVDAEGDEHEFSVDDKYSFSCPFPYPLDRPTVPMLASLSCLPGRIPALLISSRTPIIGLQGFER